MLKLRLLLPRYITLVEELGCAFTELLDWTLLPACINKIKNMLVKANHRLLLHHGVCLCAFDGCSGCSVYTELNVRSCVMSILDKQHKHTSIQHKQRS
jgi:hypothetical protein